MFTDITRTCNEPEAEADESSVDIRRCSTIDPSGFCESFYVARKSGTFTSVYFDPTTGCFTALRSFRTPMGALHLTRLIDMGCVSPYAPAPLSH